MVRYKNATVPLGGKEDNPLVPTITTTRKRPTAEVRREREAIAEAQISRQKRLKLLNERTTIEKMVGTEDPSTKVSHGRLEGEANKDDGGEKTNEDNNEEDSSEGEDEEESSRDEGEANKEDPSKEGDGDEVSSSDEESSRDEGEANKENPSKEGDGDEVSSGDEESSRDEGEAIQEEPSKKGDGDEVSSSDDESSSESASHNERMSTQAVSSGRSSKDDSRQDEGENEDNEPEMRGENEEQTDVPRPAHKKTRRKESLPDVRVIAGIKEDGPFPGGPQDNSVLRNFYDHVALKIWLGQERLIVRYHYHAKKLKEWKVDPGCLRFWSKVNASGLSTIVHSYKNVNKVVVNAIIERWHPETNTFHLPFGEMTITLDDCLQITGLSISGKILDGDSFIKKEMASKYLQEGLGLDKDVVEEELERSQGISTIRTDWIKSNFEGKEDLEDDAKVDCAVRAYLMYMIGCALVPDKSGTMMSASYMRFLLDVTKIHEYAWGASSLAYLYRQLGFSSRSGVKQLAGYLPLLEVWVYEHFPIAKGLLNPDYVEEMPRMRRWNEWPGSGRLLGDRVCTLREELDLLTPQEVVWDPYSNLRSSTRKLEEKAFYSGLLCCLQEVEGYYPDRVLRQFGRIQTIPAQALELEIECRPRTGRNYQLVYSAVHASLWKTWDNHLLNKERRGQPVVNPWDCDNLYLTWFKSNCHPRVQSPQNWKRTCPYSLESDGLEKAKEILRELLLSEEGNSSRKVLIGIRNAYNFMCGRDMGIGSNWNLDDLEEESEVEEQPTRRQTRQTTRIVDVPKTNRGRGRGRGKGNTTK